MVIPAVDVGFADCTLRGEFDLNGNLDNGSFMSFLAQDSAPPQQPQSDMLFENFVNCDALLDMSSPLACDDTAWHQNDNFGLALPDVFDSFIPDPNTLGLAQ